MADQILKDLHYFLPEVALTATLLLAIILLALAGPVLFHHCH